jgi:DNA-binding transcriptional MerR regulator
MSIDTLKVARRLREAGFSEPQAEALVEAVREGADDAELATKHDLALLESALRAEIATVRAEMREMEQRLIAKIEAVTAASMNRVVGMILGTVLVNVVTILGAMFAAVKLLNH